MKTLFDQREVVRLAGISVHQVRYWDRTGFIPATQRCNGKLLFDFRKVVAFRAVKALLDAGVPLQRIRKHLRQVHDVLPDLPEPFAALQFSADNGQMILSKGNLKFTPAGQLLLNFGPDTMPAPTVPLPLDDSLFFHALELQEQGRLDEARRIYERMLTQTPRHVDTMVNLGLVLRRQDDLPGAEACYRRALCIDPDHVEANYNLANILAERGETENPIMLYRKALHVDPGFADAYFNLARLLHARGYPAQARVLWQRYLELAPDSQWAAALREFLDDPD